jgi:hypothetical protein
MLLYIQSRICLQKKKKKKKNLIINKTKFTHKFIINHDSLTNININLVGFAHKNHYINDPGICSQILRTKIKRYKNIVFFYEPAL